MDVDLLIYSSASGHPDPTHSLGHRHWCRFTDNPWQHTVAQMRAGGWYPNADCGDACILARLLDDNAGQPMRTIEREAWTTANGGTVGDGMVAAYNANGLDAHWVDGDPPALPGMNPAWGGIIPVTDFGIYLASSTGGYIQVDTPGWWSSAGSPTEDDMAQADIDAINAHIDSALAGVSVALSAKLTAVPVAAGKARWLPGLFGGSQINLAAQDSDTNVMLIAYRLDGTPWKSKSLVLQGNSPGQRGPVQQFLAVADITGAGDPVTIGVWNQGPGDLIAVVH